jgi:hypothetical protein
MRGLSLSLALAAAMLPVPALAGTLWLCGLSADALRLVCVADDDPRDAATPAAAVETARVHGTRFPLDPHGVWTVDLWSPATDPAQLAVLAQATICYRSPGCEARLVPFDGGRRPPPDGKR